MPEGAPPPGWLRDPMGRHEFRYWDGTTWTEHVSDAGAASVDPLQTGAPTPMTVAPPVAPVAAPVAAQPIPVMPFTPVEVADIAVRLDPAAARDAVVREFSGRGFRISFQDGWNAVAERGRKGMNFVFGAFAQYYCVGVTVFTGPGGETVIRLLRAPTNLFTGGGLIGKARVSGAFAKITNELIAAFTQQGVLVGVQHA